MQNKELNINSIIKEEYKKIQDKADALFLKLSYVSFAAALLIGIVYDNLVLAVFLAATQFLLFFLSKRFIKNRIVKTYTLGIVFGSWAVVFMLATNGYYTSGFIYFAYYILLIIYQERKLLIIGPSITFVYNIIFYFFLKYDIFKEFIVNNFKNDGIFTLEELVWLILVNAVLGFSAYTLTNLLAQETIANIKKNVKQAEQIKIFERYKEFTIEIENNNLELEENISEDDSIGKSLNNIKQKLSDAIRKEEEEKFLSTFNNEGVSQISEILRTPNVDLRELSYLIVSELVKYLGANQGAIFLAEENDDGDKYLELKAAYAYERKKFFDKKILLGEGVVGTAFVENKSVYLTKLPDNYLFLKSGLGETKPKALIAQTISYNDKIVGILEIASLKKFKEYELKFIELISEYIASTIISEKAKMRTTMLLDKSTKITDNMRIKEQELSEKIQELEITNDEYKIKIEELSKQAE